MIDIPSNPLPSYAALSQKLDAVLAANTELGQEVYARIQAAEEAEKRTVEDAKLLSRCYIAFTSDTDEQTVKTLVADLAVALGVA